MKGLILAGGSGTRLKPITGVVSKQLLPVYNKPMIFYPLSTLMSLGIRDVLVICNPGDESKFQELLGDGSQFGISVSTAIQHKPGGLAEAFIIGESFVNGSSSCLVLGDNIFCSALLNSGYVSESPKSGATIFGVKVEHPSSYGVVTFDEHNRVIDVAEKPKYPKSDYAIPGLYLYDQKVVEYAKTITPSARGELEITSVNQCYLDDGQLHVTLLEEQSTWFDCGTFADLSLASAWVREKEARERKLFGSPEAVAFEHGWISANQIRESAIRHPNSYGDSLNELIKD